MRADTKKSSCLLLFRGLLHRCFLLHRFFLGGHETSPPFLPAPILWLVIRTSSRCAKTFGVYRKRARGECHVLGYRIIAEYTGNELTSFWLSSSSWTSSSLLFS